MRAVLMPAKRWPLPPGTKARLRRLARRFWRGLREWCGDAAYERYLHSACVRCGRARALSAEEFYVEQLNQRYSRPNRCC